MNSTSCSSTWTNNSLDSELNKTLLRDFKGERTAFIQVGPKRYFLPQKFAKDGPKYYNFKPRANDIWVVTFPRSGTTWTQEMVWMLANDLDFARADKVTLLERFPFLEFASCVHDDVLNEFLSEAKNEETKRNIRKACASVIDDLEKTLEPRFIKTHLPLSLLHPTLLTCGAKVIYVARNPKDVAIFFYNFHQFIKLLDFRGDFKTFWNYFEKDLIMWSPYWSHVLEGWESHRNPNLLFLFYEDMKKDLLGSVKKVSLFLQKEYSEEDLKKLVYHLEFENFKNNSSVNMESLRDLGMLMDNDQKCVRSGKAGGWKKYFPDDLNSQADEWINKNLKKSDIKMPLAK